MKITVRNAALKPLLEAFVALCAAAPPAKIAARAHRNRRVVAEALVPVQEQHNQVLLAHGAEHYRTDDGGRGIRLDPSAPGYGAALAEIRPLLEDEVELELQQIPLDEMADVRIARGGDHLGLLIDLGLATEGDELPEDDVVAVRPPAARSSKANGRRPAGRV